MYAVTEKKRILNTRNEYILFNILVCTRDRSFFMSMGGLVGFGGGGRATRKKMALKGGGATKKN